MAAARRGSRIFSRKDAQFLPAAASDVNMGVQRKGKIRERRRPATTQMAFIRKIIPPGWVLTLLLTIALLAASLLDMAPVSSVDHLIYNLFSRAGKREFAAPVAVVEITASDELEYGPWPWPRSILATMIKKLSAGGSHAIGLAIPIPKKEWNPGLAEIRKLRRKLQSGKGFLHNRTLGRIDDLLEKSLFRIDNDRKLLRALKKARNVVLPIAAAELEKDGAPTPANLPSWLKKSTLPRPGDEAQSTAAMLRGLRNPLATLFHPPPEPGRLVPVYRELARSARRHGHLYFPADSDGITRKIPLLLPYGDRLILSMPLQLALAVNKAAPDDLKISSGQKGRFEIRFRELRIPTDQHYNLLVNISRDAASLQKFTASDLLHDRIPKGFLKGKAVILGEAHSRADRILLADGTKVSTACFCALATENILNESFLSRPGWGWILETIILLYLAMFILLVVPRVSFRVGMAALGTFIVIWFGLALFLFVNNGIYFRTAAPCILLACVFIGVGLRRLADRPASRAQDNTEVNKMLGLSFQSQGLLDMAFDSFMKCDLHNTSVKEALYNLGLDFERKRMANKAISVYEYLIKDGNFKDADGRIRRLKRAESKIGSAAGPGGTDGNLLLGGTRGTRPTLGRYEIIKEIGKGAIGTVYLGLDPKINRKVAIKTLRYDDVSPDQIREVKERFFREAEAAGRLSHPNIVTIYDCGEDYDITYMAMEYLNGHDLTRYCRPNNLIPPKMVINIIIRVAFALDYAHKHEVVHRDVKPANIMLTDKGQVKVTDFGIARLTRASQTQTGVILGTPNYMSPEQVLGKKVDGRSDIFSLGAVFYEMLTGCKPFKSDNLGTLMHAISEAKYRPIPEIKPDVPPCCVAMVEKMMARNPAKRYRTAGEVVIEAQQCLEEMV